METNDEIKAVEVFAGQPWEAELLKSLLENAEIDAYLLDEFNGTMVPWVVSPGGAGAVRISVSSVDEVNARQIVDEYFKNKMKPDEIEEEK